MNTQTHNASTHNALHRKYRTYALCAYIGIGIGLLFIFPGASVTGVGYSGDEDFFGRIEDIDSSDPDFFQEAQWNMIERHRRHYRTMQLVGPILLSLGLCLVTAATCVCCWLMCFKRKYDQPLMEFHLQNHPLISGATPPNSIPSGPGVPTPNTYTGAHIPLKTNATHSQETGVIQHHPTQPSAPMQEVYPPRSEEEKKEPPPSYSEIFRK